MNLTGFHLRVTLVALFLYAATAWNSKGYYHPDEHYQIIEFAGLKLGTTDITKLPWEYGARMRSSIQPAICAGLFLALRPFGISDVYGQAFALRLLTALLAILAIHLFVNAFLVQVRPKNAKTYILLSYFLWFLPFLNVRFSSETWSGLFFLLAVATVQKNNTENYKGFILTGVFAALSFLCRFQAAFLIIGLLLWMVVIGKKKPMNMLALLLAGTVILQAGILIDTWYYGEYLYTFWNYFKVNIIQDKASEFGTAPWYRIIEYIITAPGIPWGALILSSLLVLSIRQPRSLLVWVVVPFLLIHAITPHKEDRFLFPLANFMPLLLILGFQEVEGAAFLKKNVDFLYYPLRALVAVLLLTNLAGLLYVVATAAANGRTEITQYIHEKYKDKNVRLICGPLANPYNPWMNLPTEFYKEKNLSEQNIPSLCVLDTSLLFKGCVNLLTIRQSDQVAAECSAQVKVFNGVLEKQSIPGWAAWVWSYYKNEREEEPLILYSINVLPATPSAQ
jgi:phosphatidylinositol glycan class B